MDPGNSDRSDGSDSPHDSFESRTVEKEVPTNGEADTNPPHATGRSLSRPLTAALVAGMLVLAVAVGGALAVPTPSPDVQPALENESALTVAFVADAGMSDETREVLSLVADENTDVVVYSGDFDYQDDPEGWVELLDEELGADTPVVAAIGNHDVERWDDYQRVLRERLARSDAVQCTGDLGWRSTCTVGDLTVLQSSAGICDYDDPPKAEYLPERCADYDPATDEAYVADQLSNATTTWTVCSWHLVNERYQMGDKENLVPASLYDTCREGGAIVATGHDHTYARTYPMANFSTATVADESPPYTIGDGSSFAFVSAATGYSFYDTTDRADAPYWDATHTDGEFGAFFCTFRSDGTGECYFKTVAGEIVDGPFEIRRPAADGTTPGQPATTASTTENTVELRASPDNAGVADVSFVVDGEADYGPESEADTDTIESTAGGTRVTSVGLDPGALDSYLLTGPVVDFTLPEGYDVDVTWNGDATTFEELVVVDSDPLPDASASLPNTLVVSGADADDVTEYTFTVSGDVERDAEASSSDSSSLEAQITDTATGTEVVGGVGDGVEVYRFSGRLTSVTVGGHADFRVEMG